MSRDPYPNELDRTGERDSSSVGITGGVRGESRFVEPPVSRSEPEREASSRTYYLRDRAYALRESDFQTLLEIGQFRVIDSKDLAEFAYRGNAEETQRGLRSLRAQGLVETKPLGHKGEDRERLVVLTKKGRQLLLASGRVPQDQAIYRGLVKPREAKHDAGLYRLYQHEVARLAASGSKVTRVKLDYELKRDLQRDLAGLGDDAQPQSAREEVAEKHGLALLNDKIQVPDLRLEYESADHEQKFIDLELANRNYRPRAVAQKAKAGFALYALREDASKLRRILDDNELTARIFAL
jgi:DNA-binding MarR family transcriptional regulator